MQDNERGPGENLSDCETREEACEEDDLFDQAMARVAAADADPGHRPVLFEEALGEKACAMFKSINADAVSDSELFE